MLSPILAMKLKGAGLVWEPKLHDFFTVPETVLANRLFVVSDMTIDVQKLFGSEMITFNGAVEWSLDYITMTEALWVPTEAQLRNVLLDRLRDKAPQMVTLESTPGGFRCEIIFEHKPLAFEASNASDAYARALLYVLRRE